MTDVFLDKEVRIKFWKSFKSEVRIWTLIRIGFALVEVCTVQVLLLMMLLSVDFELLIGVWIICTKILLHVFRYL